MTTLSTVVGDDTEEWLKSKAQTALTETDTGKFIIEKFTAYEKQKQWLKENDPRSLRNLE